MQILMPGQGAIAQPFNTVLFPTAEHVGPFGVDKARAIPGVARALGVIAGTLRQMPLEDVRGTEVMQSPPAVLEQPDPETSRSWWVGVMVEDYLLHGNAVALVTSRNSDGWPASLSWYPATSCMVEWDEGARAIRYRVGGQVVPTRDVVHVARGADPRFPWRGMGVVEQHLRTLRRVAGQEDYEASQLDSSGIPSVVITTPNPDLSQETARQASDDWLNRYRERRPAILPAGSVVTPLSWSPHDAEMVEARKLSKADVADIFNLDGYWLGVEVKGLTYRTPGPLYLNLVRQTCEPIAQDLEGALSAALLPRGRQVRLQRSAVMVDDLPTELSMLAGAVDSGLMTWEEARKRLGLSADPKYKPKPKPVPNALKPFAGSDSGDPAGDSDTDPEGEK